MLAKSIKFLIVCTSFVLLFQLPGSSQDKPSQHKQHQQQGALPHTKTVDAQRVKHIDALTSMFYHIENTRKCGDNLQTFDTIDFKSLWLKKFKAQTSRIFSLANSLNHLISNVEKNEPKNLNEVHIIESNILPALSYFLFQSDKLSSDLVKQSYAKIPTIKHQKQSSKKVQEDEEEKIPSGDSSSLKFQDPFMIGFGVLLFYDIKEAPTEFQNLRGSGDVSKTIKCFYLYTRTNSTHEMDASSLVRNRACLAIDADGEAAKSARNTVNPNFSFHSTESLSANSKSDEFYTNCNKWYD